MIILITPCSRPQNLPKLFDSVRFASILHWYIVHDTDQERKILPPHPQITEVSFRGPGIAGNPQRNHALQLNKFEGHVYFLDDDNIIHPKFWDVPLISKIVTFDLVYNDGSVRQGDRPEINHIDTAMFLVHSSLTRAWKSQLYNADGHFIQDTVHDHPFEWTHIPLIAAYWNKLR